MRTFIEDYMDWVREALNDTSTTKRLTTTQLLRDLHAHHQSVYEKLLRVSGTESTFSYAEASITLQSGREYYRLPGNFRFFLGFEKREDGDPNKILCRLPSIADWNYGPGIIISSPELGFRIRPVPQISADETWVLRYQKGPIVLHYGDGLYTPGNFRLQASIPAEQGERVDLENYYANELIHFPAPLQSGIDTTMNCTEVLTYNPISRGCTLRNNPAYPGTDVRYEFRTFLPRGMDKLIALSVALNQTANRSDPEKRKLLKDEWNDLWVSAKSYVKRVARDKLELRPKSQYSEVDPYAH